MTRTAVWQSQPIVWQVQTDWYGVRVGDLLRAFWGSRTLPLLLGYLTERPGEEFTLGQLQADLAANRESLHRALQRALAAGLVSRRRLGNQYLYQADRSSPFYPEVKSLCSKMLGAASTLARALEALGAPRVEQAFIYGSVARAGDDARSDIDVMVLGEATDFELHGVLDGAQERIRRPVNWFGYSRRVIERRLAAGDGFLLEVFGQPKVMLVGSEDQLPAIPEIAG